MIVVTRGACGSPVALLPLAVRSIGPIRIGMFLGGRESNFNLGLFRADAGFDEPRVRRLLIEAARQSKSPVDLYHLRNQPRRFEATDNPLALANAQPSPSFAYGATLPADLAALEKRSSKEARRKQRQKEARLSETGDLLYEHCADGQRAIKIARALLTQKSARLAAMGASSTFDNPAMRKFIEESALASGDGALEFHALSIDGRILATYAGLARRGRFSLLMNSFDMDPEISRSSPGDLLLQALLRNLVTRGFTHFDLGAGEARYKNAVCDETIELCDVVFPTTLKGVLAAPFLTAYVTTKRKIKQTPSFARFAARARALLKR
jgi:CelD/BcsL family acetyltransferase involved in cellulose biosynthesis